MLSACATVSQPGLDDEDQPTAEATKPELNLPNVELTPEILNKLLTAEIALQRNRFDTATESYHQLAKETLDPRIAERATRIALFVRDYKTAADAANLWTSLSPDNIEGHQILTTLLVKEGDQEGAVKALEEVLSSDEAKEDNTRYLMIIRLLGREQNRELAMNVVGQYLEKYPSDGSALFAYSQLALRATKFDIAESAVEELLTLKPNWVQAIVLKSRILRATNRDEAAKQFLKKEIAKQGKDSELRIAYGRILVDAEQLEEAYTQFQKVLKLEPENSDIAFTAGLIALRLEKLDDAKEYFLELNHKAVRVNETAYYLGRTEEARENDERAIYWYSAVSRGDNYLNAKIRGALLKARGGDVDGARALLGAVQAANPGQRMRLYLAEGEILRDVELYEEALKVYNQALEEVPGNTELLYARAMVSERLDNIEQTEEDLRAILEREPDHVDALNSLGYTLTDRTDRHEEAYEYIKRAMELRPDVAYIMDSMGWVHFRLGNFQKAKEYLQRAMEIQPDPEIAAHLGEVLWAMDDRESARSVWNEALEEAPGSPILLNTIKRLEK